MASPETLYEIARGAASTWSQLINPAQREPFLSTVATDAMHSRVMSKIIETLSSALGGGQAPTGNQTVPPSGQMTPQDTQRSAQQSLQSSPWGQQVQAMIPGSIQPGQRPPTPEQQRETDMHNGLLDFFHSAMNAPGEGLSWVFHHADPFYDPSKDVTVTQGVSPDDPQHLAAQFYANAAPAGFPAWKTLNDDQKKQVAEMYRKFTVEQAQGGDYGMGLQPPQEIARMGLQSLIGEADPIAKVMWNATKPEGDPDWDHATEEDKNQFMAVLALSGLQAGQMPIFRTLGLTKTGSAIQRVAWAHLAATTAAGRKLPGVDRVVSRILPGAEKIDTHAENELKVVSNNRRGRDPQLDVDPKKTPIESALDIPPAENISQRMKGGKPKETFQPLETLPTGEMVQRVSNMPQKTREAFFKQMGVSDLDQFKDLVAGKRLSSKQVDWLAKRWKTYFPYDLRRVDVAEADLRDPRQHLDALQDDAKVNGQEFLASTHGLLSETMTGPFGSDGAMAGSLMRSLLGLQRGTSATVQRWQETMTTFLKGHENIGDLERKAIEGNKAAFDQLSPTQKTVVDAHRLLEANLRKLERQWDVRKDHVPNFFPRRFVRPAAAAFRKSTAGTRPGVSPLTSAVTAHREEVFQTETPEQASQRLDAITHERDSLQETLASVREQLAEFDPSEQRKGGPGYELAKQARKLQQDLRRTEGQLKYTDPQYILQQRFGTVEEANDALRGQRETMVEQLTADPAEGGMGMDPAAAAKRADEAYPSLETNYYRVGPQDLGRRIQALHSAQAVKQLEATIIEDGGEQLQAAYRGVPNREMQELLANRGYRSLNWGAMRDVQWHPLMADTLDRAHALQAMPRANTQRVLRALERKMIGRIMYSPMLHGMNVAGRVGWYMVANPMAFSEQLMRTIGASTKPIFDRRVWNDNRKREAFNAGLLPHSPSRKYGSEFYEGLGLGTSDTEAGNVPGYNDLTDAPEKIKRSPLAGPIGLGKAIGRGYDGMNNLFWSRVNDFGVVAYQVEKHKALNSGLDESTARLYAADRANAWMGHVRPERWMPFAHELSRLVFFAPNWWRTFGELTTGHYDKTGLVRNAALRNHVIKNEVRTLMAMWAFQHVSGNVLNLMLAGHPQWENQPGNQDRLELDNFFPVDPQTGAHMTLEPFLSRQTYAAEKGLGLESGHPGWNVEDVPGSLAAVAGARLSPLASALGYAANIDLYNSFSRGHLSRVDPNTRAFYPAGPGLLAALSSLVPLAPGLDVARSAETLATKGGGPEEALGLPGTGNTTVPKNVKDALGKGVEKLLLGVIGINPPYPYAERSRGQNLSQDELIKVKQKGDEYYGRLQEISRQMFDGSTTPMEALKSYRDLTTAYQGFLSAEFQNAPYYTHGALGLYHAWEDTYRQATGADGQIDWAKLDDLQAKFEHDHSSAEMSAIQGFRAKSEVKAPFLRIYHETIDAYRNFQEQQAAAAGVSVTDLRRAASQYGDLYNDRVAAAHFLRDHPELRRYEQAKKDWEATTNAGLMYGMFYSTGTVMRWLRQHGLDMPGLLKQIAGQGQLSTVGPS